MDNDPDLFDIAAIGVEAITQPQRWYDLLDALVARHRLRGATVFFFDPWSHESGAAFVSRYYRQEGNPIHQAFLEGKDASDGPLYSLARTMPPLHLMSEQDMCGLPPGAQLPPSEFRDLMRDIGGVQARLTMRLNDVGPWIDMMALHALQPPTQVSPEIYRELNAIGPVLARCVETQRTLAVESRLRLAIVDALERLTFGVAIIGRNREVLVANSYFKQVMEDGDGLSLDRNQRLTTWLSENRSALNALLAAMLDLRSGTELCAITIRRRSNRQDYVLKGGSLDAGELDYGRHTHCAVLFLIDPDDPQTYSLDGIKALDVLTPAETEVCNLVVEGCETREIADRRAVTLETVRSQIKDVLGKLNCSNRLQLLRLVLSTHPPVR